MDTSIVFPLLLLMHFLGDFMFQPEAWVKDKEEHHYKSKHLIFHVLVHTGLALGVILIHDYNQFYWAFVLGILHWIIDATKAYFSKRDRFYNNNKWSAYFFIMDQLIHIGTVVLISSIVLGQIPNLHTDIIQAINYENMMVVTAYYIVYSPLSFFMRIATQKWHKDILKEETGLKSAGKWIGRLERILILTFMLIDQFSAIGFLLGAKSVLRLSGQKQTEYIVIGTLTSFAATIILGIVLKMAIA